MGGLVQSGLAETTDNWDIGEQMTFHLVGISSNSILILNLDKPIDTL